MSVLADCLSQFSTTQGSNGWTYGYLLTPGNPASWTAAGMSIYGPSEWGGPYDSSTPRLSSAYLHPGIGTGGGVNVSAAARWTSTYGGYASVSWAGYRPYGGGDGTTLRVYVDNAFVASGDVPNNAGSGSLIGQFSLSIGSIVIFEVDAKGTAEGDATYPTVMRIETAVSPLLLRRRLARRAA